MSTDLSPAVVPTADELTDAWLAEVLARPGLRIEQVTAIGTGQMSQSHRVTFTADDGHGTVVVKLASADPTSRQTGVGMGAYKREIDFYAGLAPRMGAAVPQCFHAAYDPNEGWFTLVLEDMAGAQQGDQIGGATLEQAQLAVTTLARLHGPVLGDLHVGSLGYLNQPNPLNQALYNAVLPGFLERYADRVAPEHREVLERFAPVLDAWFADHEPPLGLVHGDYRLDNLLFSEDRCTAVDWQTVMWGPALYDLAYFIAGSFDPEDRRAHERELVERYHAELVAQGVQTLSLERCWEDYRRQCFGGLLMTVVASMVVERTERGDDMFMTWLRRNAQQVLDLGSLDLLPDPDAPPPAALQPDPEDEGRHEPGPEDTWNESWYFDGISDDGTLGVYTRLGRMPNRDAALFTACITGVGRPSIMLVDAAAPLPPADDDHQVIAIEGLHAEQICEVPLERFRVRVSGTARAHADHAAPLRAEEGEPINVAIDLLWETTGVPYQWRRATRYEIPCRVTGTVRIGDEELAFAGPGQRDHSWGVRDWFASDWMWNALHLDDGTHTHAVGVPQVPGFGVGYVQRDGEVTEVETLHMETEVREDGLIATATISGAGLETRIEPLAWGALRLEAPDGRVSQFPRAMCRVHAADGRGGLGWIEWNRNQREEG